MGTEARRATIRRALSILDRWLARTLLALLLIATAVVFFLILGAGAGGSGDP